MWSQRCCCQSVDASGDPIGGSGLHQLNSPKGIAIDTTGALLVADTGNQRVLAFGGTGYEVFSSSTSSCAFGVACRIRLFGSVRSFNQSQVVLVRKDANSASPCGSKNCSFAHWPGIINPQLVGGSMLDTFDLGMAHGCPFEKLTGFCKGSATCHGLAHSGLTCEGLANIAECATFCAYPCCNSATTSTATTTTFTTHTHTFTETSSTTTTISTITSTTVTVPTTVTSTASTTTTTQTDFMDSTTSIDVSGGPAAVMKISMRVEVTDPQDYLQYFDDDAVQAAYINVMSTVASIPKNLVELERTSSELGYLTMTYVITIPYTNDTPSIPVAPVQEKLSSIDIPTFNEMLDAEMREVPGGSDFQQKVVSLSVADDISVNLSREKSMIAVRLTFAFAICSSRFWM
eukprot:symbB.v1.2.007892.t1/scaffold489.1/size197246/10